MLVVRVKNEDVYESFLVQNFSQESKENNECCESERVIKSFPCAMAGHGNAMPMKIQYFIIHNRSRSIIIFYLSSLSKLHI